VRSPSPVLPSAERADAVGAPANAAELRALRVELGEREVLRGVDLDVPRGAITVIAGPNGSGKSTLLEALAGVLAPSGGTARRLAAAHAYVPQRSAAPERLPVTVRDVAAIGAWALRTPLRQRRAVERMLVDDALARVGMLELASRPFAKLSGGQRQRVLLAQGLARGADLLLLDEPTTGLDAGQRAAVLGVLGEEARRGVAVLAVSHEPELIAAADRVLRLEDGQLAR
jgi:zinc/manganese transport system ATP-binding protein